MKKLLVLLLMAVTLSVLSADLYSKDHQLFEIKSKHFTFIYPEDCQSEAFYLVQNAEQMLKDICGLLNTTFEDSLPVALTKDHQSLNGGFTPFPSNRIYLYLAPISPDSGFVVYNDSLRKLFLHELTHAVSMNIKEPFAAFLASVFCDILSPSALFTQPVFIEGVTVSFESLDGFGRATQPGYASIIQQAIIEDGFMDPNMIGVFNKFYPGGIWYVYGGYFSRFLQQTYGMEKYALLWKEFGKGISPDSSIFFKGAIDTVYGKTFPEIWEEFRQYMMIKVPVVTATVPLSVQFSLTGPLAAFGQKLYYAVNDDLVERDLVTGNSKKLASVSYSVSKISLSEDGKSLLISDVIYDAEGISQLRVRIVDLVSGETREAGLPAGLSEASWHNGGILAVRNKGCTADIVYVKDGMLTVLLEGRDFFIPGVPQSYSRNEIVFLANVKGVNAIFRFDPASKLLTELVTATNLKTIRNMSCTDSVITFSYDNDLTLYKLGVITGNKLRLQETPLSGGIEYPVPSGDQFYYVGSFSNGQKLMRYPSENGQLALSESAISWKPSVIPADSDRVLDQELEMEIHPYNVLGWSLLPQAWVPIFTIDTLLPPEEMFTSFGVLTFSSDPTQGHTLLSAFNYYYSANYLAADIQYVNATTPLNVSLRGFIGPGDSRFSWTNFGATIGLSQNIPASESMSISWSANTTGQFFSKASAGLHPYLWPVTGVFLPFAADIRLSFSDSGSADPSDRDFIRAGVDLDGWVVPLTSWIPKTTAGAFASLHLDTLEVTMELSGRVSLDSALSLSPAGLIEDAEIVPSAVSGFSGWSWYKNRSDLNDFWYAQAFAEFGQDLKIRQLLLGIPVEALIARAGYKAVFCDGVLLNAFYAKLALSANISVGIIGIDGLVCGIDAFWLPDQDTARTYGWDFFFQY